nr:hypothetical protein [Mycoplasmopsis bovis]
MNFFIRFSYRLKSKNLLCSLSKDVWWYSPHDGTINVLDIMMDEPIKKG